MAIDADIARYNYRLGEASPEFRAQAELGQAAVDKLENMIVLLEGGVTRRPGTMFVTAVKTESQKGKLIRCRFDPVTAYVQVFNGGKMRVIKNGVQQGGPFELTIPYLEADLPNLRTAQSGNIQFVACDGYQPRQITRLGDTNWTIAAYANIGGPVEPQNLDTTQTIVVSATTGTGITLTSAAAGPAFQAGHIGGVWRLDESDLSLIPQWLANEPVTIATEAVPASATYIGNANNRANAFDNNPATNSDRAASSLYVGRTHSPSTAALSVTVTASASVSANSGQVVTGTIGIYGKVGSAPASDFDGVKLGEAIVNVKLDPLSGSTTATFPSATINLNDTVTNYDDLWITLSASASPGITAVRVIDSTWTRFSTTGNLVLRRFSGNVYQAINGTNTGTAAPTHSSGDVLSQTGGVVWRYRHRDRGFVRITAVASATSATADVLERIPDSVLARATYRWWQASWDSVQGWPTNVTLSSNSITWTRKDRWWRTKPASFFDFDTVDPTDPGQALSGRFVSPYGSLVWVQWVSAVGISVFGTSDDEWILRGPGAFDALTAQNIIAFPDEQIGSAPQIIEPIAGGVLFFDASRIRMFAAKFSPLAQHVDIDDLTLTASHVLKPGALRVAWQRNPKREAWIVRSDGVLVGLTFLPKEKVIGWSRHPMTNGAVEDVCAIAAGDESATELYMIVRRTINGATHRYVEKLAPFFAPVDPNNPDARGAWFVDCGLRYQGAPATTITGLNHLIGQTVNVHADGYMQTPQVVNNSGAITLPRSASDVIVGLPMPYRIRTLPLDLQTQTGPVRGRKQKPTHVHVYLINSAGGFLTANPDQGSAPEPLDPELTGAMNYGAAIPLVTDLVQVKPAAALDDEAVIEISGSDTMPFTLAGIFADDLVTES